MSRIYFILGISLFVKLLVSAWIPIFSDEAYYWVWSHNLQLSYYDHPPFVSWLFYLGRPLENFFSAIRWPGIILGHLTLLVWVQLLKPHLSSAQLILWLGIALFSPLFGVGSLIITPDIPLLFFWSLSLYFFSKILEKPSNLNYILLGGALGLGFLSKYNIVLFVPIAWIVLWAKGFRDFRTLKGIVLSFLMFILCSLPLWIWNIQNDFISFGFQAKHGLAANNLNIEVPLRFIVEQILIIFPLFWYFAMKKPKTEPLAWLMYFAWGPILFFFLASFKGKAEANWTLVAYPSIYVVSLINGIPRAWVQRITGLWALVFCGALVVLCFQWPELIPSKLKEIRQYDSLVKKLKETPSIDPIYARTYQMASLLSFQLKRPIMKLKSYGRTDFYDFVESSQPTSKRIYFVVKKNEVLPQSLLDLGYGNHQVIQLSGDFNIIEAVR